MLNFTMHSHSITDLQNAVKPLGISEYSNAHTYWLEPLTVPSVGSNGEKYPEKQEGNNPMYANTINTVAANYEDSRDTKQRRYLRSQASDAFYALKRDLKEKFFITVPNPTTLGEAIQRIKDGKFSFDYEKDAERDYSWGLLHYINWRTEEMKEDQDGYKAARARLNKAYNELEQDIEILDPERALSRLRDFAAKDFSKEDESSYS